MNWAPEVGKFPSTSEGSRNQFECKSQQCEQIMNGDPFLFTSLNMALSTTQKNVARSIL